MADNIGVPAGTTGVLNPSIPQPGTIGNKGTYTSDVVSTYGYPHIAVAATIDQAGTLSMQRYLDRGGTVVAGSAVTAAMSANTLATIDNLGTIISQSVKVSIVNGATAAATIAGITVVVAPT